MSWSATLVDRGFHLAANFGGWIGSTETDSPVPQDEANSNSARMAASLMREG
jgi:hypothetical protein